MTATRSLRSITACGVLLFCLSALDAAEPARPGMPVEIGSRRELFVDDALIESMTGKVELRLHSPVPREVAIRYDQPWEGNASGYATVFPDGELFRMYYRGHRYLIDDKPLRQAQSEVVCYAESRDGIHWEKPRLGLFAWKGSKDNNIIWMGGPEAHNFAPFKDANPACRPDERYKAIGGTVTSKGLLTFKSADGIHWSRLSEQPVVTKGAFDSHNTCFWDAERGRYTMYVRFFSEGEFKGLRLIGVSYSSDFKTWTEPRPLEYPGSPPQQMYTNQIAPYFRAPHLLMGFPTRYVARPLNEHGQSLDPVPLRDRLTRSHQRLGTDLTDGLFMTSRDTQTFHRFDEAFLRPGPQEEGRWIYGDNYQSYGLWETRPAHPGASNEISMHFSEHAWVDETHQARRYTIRLDGFVSLHAAYAGGDIVTRPLRFTGNRLELNYATSAAGGVRVELQDEAGSPIPGFTLADCLELYGDSTAQPVAWKSGADVRPHEGKTIRVRFQLKDADLFALQFVNSRSDRSAADSAARVKQVIGHRGACAETPENTLAGIRRAIESGAHLAEVDVRTTKDGVLVCLHDAEVDRTTDGTGKLANLTLAEVTALDAGTWFDARFQGEKIPTLREVLEAAKGRIGILLDLKESGNEYAIAVARHVQEFGEPARCQIGVRSAAQARHFRELLPDTRQIGLIPEIKDIEDFAAAGVTTIRLWPKWLPDEKAVKAVRKHGLQLHLGTGEGTTDEVLPLLEFTPESLSSDNPAQLLQALAALRRAAERPSALR